jgi:Transposase DDE domain
MHFDMSVETFLTVLYCVIDELYQTLAPTFLAGKVGTKPEFSDSEVLTLMVAQHWCGFQKEATFLRFIKNNYLELFPRLLDQSQFNRRARNLCWLLNRLRFEILQKMGALQETIRLIDGTPVHVRHWRRYGKSHIMLPDAALGYCAAKKETFYGYRLVVMTTLDGVITDWELISGNADEREAAWDLLYEYRHLHGLGDKGFLDRLRQEVLEEDRDVVLLTPKRKNQKEQNAPGWDAALNRVRRLIETTFAQGKDGFGLEKPFAKTLWGLISRVIAKLTGMTIAAWFNRQNGRSPLTLASFTF